MSPLRRLLPLLLVAALGTSACLVPPEEQAATPAPPSFPLALTDDDGETLELDEAPETVAALDENHEEILDLLDVESVRPSSPDDPPSEESVLALDADLLLLARRPGGEPDLWTEGLRDAGVPVFVLSTGTFDDLLHDILTLGRLTGTNQEAEDLIGEMAEKAGDVLERAEEAGPLTCVLESLPFEDLGPGILHTARQEQFSYHLLQEAGCDPVDANTVDELLEADPDVYLVTGRLTAEAVKAREALAGLDAIRSNRVFAIDAELLNPDARAADGLVAIADALYPDSAEEEEDEEATSPTPSVTPDESPS